MTVTTSRGKTFPADWAWAPAGADQGLMLQIRDARPLSAIAADFEGCEAIRRESAEEGDMAFDGYTALTGIQRVPGGARITLGRES